MTFFGEGPGETGRDEGNYRGVAAGEWRGDGVAVTAPNPLPLEGEGGREAAGRGGTDSPATVLAWRPTERRPTGAVRSPLSRPLRGHPPPRGGRVAAAPAPQIT